MCWLKFVWTVIGLITLYQKGGWGKSLSALCTQNGKPVPCMSATFSPLTPVLGAATFISDHGCSVRGNGEPILHNKVAIVRRGLCSFEQKAVVAESWGALGLIILDVSGGELFPPGASDPAFQSKIPVVLAVVSPDYADSWAKDEMWISFPDASELPPVTLQLAEHISVLKLELLGLFIVSIVAALIVLLPLRGIKPSLSPFSTRNSLIQIAAVLSVLILVGFGIVLRIVTLRAKEPSKAMIDAGVVSPGLHGFNHVETDEVIFEALTRAVHFDWRDYTLRGKPILSALGLARENYDHVLFPHPPVFVFVTSWLHYFAGIPLPMVPILYQAITALSIPFIVQYILSCDTRLNMVTTVSQHAVLSFFVCPLAWFCSQKLWIDNAAMMTVSLSAAIHVCFCSSYRGAQAESKDSSALVWFLVRNIFSGWVFGTLALCTKLTATAAIPFLMCWSIGTVLLDAAKNVSGKPKKTDDSIDENVVSNKNESAIVSSQVVFRCVLVVLAIAVGAFAGLAPWMMWYKAETGRWLPSAWPSAEMLARSSFVKKAVENPWYQAFIVLCSALPHWIVALLFGIATAIFSLQQLLSRSSAHKLDEVCLRCAAAATVPLCYIIGHMALGAMGAGFQTRFLLPASPFCAVLFAMFAGMVERGAAELGDHAVSGSILAWTKTLLLWLLVYISITGWFYGVQFPTMYADLDAGGPPDAIERILYSKHTANHGQQFANAESRQWITDMWAQHGGYRK